MDQAHSTAAADKVSGWRGSRELWLDAAQESFVESGLDAVKIQPLAARLNLSRTSFYWFFKDRAELLDALLDNWENVNSGSLASATSAYAETISEAVLNLISIFLQGGPFQARLDLAVRGWAHQSDSVAARVHAADEFRLRAIRAMFTRFGYGAGEADVRARTVYLVQIGYIAMQVHEDMATRMNRIPDYVVTFTGCRPSDAELRRFYATHGFCVPEMPDPA
ncbi:TetR/AcrR family transcriptional regulator [Roseinatronobacter alkalisoli]|uniref:TetR/AcrR family transcriptional regulator n=1 Tax=Roseinatronobacter alkalisoli TaxID=3028235 RepID=A0ABT5TDC6_9RHOB|nr:TetR/AcrR family transcriptional regulator [Roseinatronobacter sp. HJB301]MDD7971913.1 TetR/AcrR family transcriptional regulator [Roseinatronobacter sp. HJB301]